MSCISVVKEEENIYMHAFRLFFFCIYILGHIFTLTQITLRSIFTLISGIDFRASYSSKNILFYFEYFILFSNIFWIYFNSAGMTISHMYLLPLDFLSVTNEISSDSVFLKLFGSIFGSYLDCTVLRMSYRNVFKWPTIAFLFIKSVIASQSGVW